MVPSIDSVIKRLETQGGRDFTLAVLDAFEYLGFEVEDIEETQGTQAHSDLIVKAPLATNPYFAVLECTAVREGSEVNYQKLYQLESNFPRYVTKYSKLYPSASYKMLVGRPSFSPDTKKLAKDTTLMTAEILVRLLKSHEEYYLSQDELERIFPYKREITEHEVKELTAPYEAKTMLYAWIYLSLLKDPTSKPIKRTKEWTNVERVIAIVDQWGWLFHGIRVKETLITNAIRDLSSTPLRVLLVDGQKVLLSSLPLEKIIQNMGDLGKTFEKYLTDYQNRVKKLREISKK